MSSRRLSGTAIGVTVVAIGLVVLGFCVGQGAGPGNRWLVVQTFTLIATGVVVWWYTSETWQLRAVGEEQLGLLRSASIGEGDVARATFDLHQFLVHRQLVSWIGRAEVGGEARLWKWLWIAANRKGWGSHSAQAATHLETMAGQLGHIDAESRDAFLAAVHHFYEACDIINDLLADQVYVINGIPRERQAKVGQAATQLRLAMTGLQRGSSPVRNRLAVAALLPPEARPN